MPAPDFVELLRPELRALTAYVPHPGEFPIRLDANEAPNLLSDVARARLAEQAARIAWERYPDARSEDLRQALADYSGVDREQVLCGVGSDEVISILMTALSQPHAGNDAPVVLTTTPSFVMYAMGARIRGQRVLEVPLDSEWDLSIPSVLAATRVAEPTLVFIASPNNPTGNKMSLSRLAQLIEAMPRSLVVVDEAYIDYSDTNQLALFERYENVAVLRTLSKIGFAALRIGWLIGRPELVRELDKARQPYNMPSLSQALGAFALRELRGDVRQVIRTVVSERERLSAALAALPSVRVTPSQANFLWVNGERPAGELFAGLKARGILVRSFHERGGRLGQQLRVTVGTPQENRAFLEAFTALV